MRFSVIFSLLIAVIAAGGAVWGARAWLAQERANIINQNTAPAEEVVEVPKNTIVVAREQISFAERLTAANLVEIEWGGAVLPDASFKTIDELVIDDSEENARYAISSMGVGEPIIRSKITEPGVRAKLSVTVSPGMKAVSIRVNDVLGVAGFIQPGDRVDVMLTRSGFVDLLLQGVKVLAIDQIADENNDQPSVVRTVTFEVSTEEAGKLTLGSQVGLLSLALRNLVSTDIEPPTRITLDDLSDFDVSDELIEDIAALEEDAEAAVEEEVTEAAEPLIDPNEERFANLELLMRDMAGTLNTRLQTMETKLQEPEVTREEVRATPQPALPVVATKVAVGVIRNGQRVEYKVDAKNEEEESDADVQQVELE